MSNPPVRVPHPNRRTGDLYSEYLLEWHACEAWDSETRPNPYRPADWIVLLKKRRDVVPLLLADARGGGTAAEAALAVLAEVPRDWIAGRDGRPTTPQEQMTRRAQALAGQLVEAARQPDSPEFLAGQEAHERRQAAVIAAYHAVRRRPDEPPGQALPDLAALRAHVAGKERHGSQPAVDIDWITEEHQVRFTVRPAIDVPADRRAAVAALVAKANALSGLEVWRTEPELAVEHSVPLHDGILWTRDADRALRIVTTTLARDLEELREAASGQ